MELKKILEVLKPYQKRYCPLELQKIENIDLTDKHGKIKLIIAIALLYDSLKITRKPLKNKFDFPLIKKMLVTCRNYKDSISIVSGNLSDILYMTLDSVKSNKVYIEYEVLPHILSGKKTYDDLFVKNAENRELNNDWYFAGANGDYSGRGFRDLLKLTGNEMKDILLENYGTFNDDIKLAISYLYNEDNKQEIMKHFKQVRLGAVSIFKSILTQKNQDFVLYVKRKLGR